tara:strand:+ start:22 stop:1785 length:1764 start_codon:yes stop_codon:yes gene_type:complete
MKSLKTYINEAKDSTIDQLMKTVGGGTKSAGVFESWVHIVSSYSGDSAPTDSQIKTTRNHEEFNEEGENWLSKIEDKIKDGTYTQDLVAEAINYVGDDVKKITAINWPQTEVIHQNVTKYYKALPPVWKTKKSKQNTADIIYITSGTKEELLKKLPDCKVKGTIGWTDDGKCFIPDTNLEWYQVSLKKGKDDARIGKLTTFLKGKYGAVTNIRDLPTEVNASVIERGNYLGIPYGWDDQMDKILLDEGLFDAFKSLKDKIVGSFKKLASWAAGKLRKIAKGVIKVVKKILKSNPAIDNANKILKLSGVKNLGESFLLEDKDQPVIYKTQKVVDGVLEGFEALKKQLNNDMVKNEWDKIDANVSKMNSRPREMKTKPAVLLFASEGTAAEASAIDKSVFMPWVDDVIKKLKDWPNNDPIMRKDLFLPLKVASHYTAYAAINSILEDIIKKSGEFDDVLAATMQFVASSKAEAKFGNTELPLWIVYGSGGGVEYLGLKDTFVKTTAQELTDSSPAKKLDQPYLVIRIEKAKSSASTFDLSGHNVTEVYLMSGIDESKQMPKYLVLNLTTVSGSNFSMKAEVEKEVTKEW